MISPSDEKSPPDRVRVYDPERVIDIFRLCKDCFEQQESRFNQLNTKANIYFTIISFIIALQFTALPHLTASVHRELPPYLFMIEMILYASFNILFVFAMWQVTQALRIEDYKGYPQDILNKYAQADRQIILATMSSCLQEAARHNHKKNNEKARLLKRGIICIRLGVVAAIMFLGFAIMKSPLEGTLR